MTSIEQRDLRSEHLGASVAGADSAGWLRRALLALVLFGAVGLVLELLLLEHFESALQFIPLVLLGFVLVSATVLARRPSVRAIQIFRVVMLLCVVAGVAGVFLHYRGNVEFELERQPLRHGLDLFWEAIRGATPALAPGALTQLGLLGLVYTFRHPALSRVPSKSTEGSNVNYTERT
jgi:hypothetical protein